MSQAPANPSVCFDFEGNELEATSSDTVASALIRRDLSVLSRSVKYHRPRGAFCLRGSCGSCLMRIDGRPNERACTTRVRAGLRVERQNAVPSGEVDLLELTDLVFPDGMDHHTLFTRPRILNDVVRSVVRRLAGLGQLPDWPSAPSTAQARPELPRTRSRRVEALVVGGGPAGLAAATALARAGRQTLLVEELPEAGGSYLADPRTGPLRAESAIEEARRAGVELLCDATVLGYYPEERPEPEAPLGLLALYRRTLRGEDLLLVSAERVVYATGAHDRPALCGGNDRPGVYAARAVGRLLFRHGHLVGRRVLLAGEAPGAEALAQALTAHGAEVTRVAAEALLSIEGRLGVERAVVRSAGGRPQRIACDTVAVATLPAPASELCRSHGARVRYEAAAGGFAVVRDEAGRVAPSVWACGDVAGYAGPQAAARDGERIGSEASR